MNRKFLTPLIAATAAAGLLLVPVAGYAGVTQDLQKQIKDLDQQSAAMQKKQQDADKKAAQAKSQMQQEKKNLGQIQNEIAEQGKQVDAVNKQLADVEAKLSETADRLEEAEARVQSRDGMLRSRARLMYMNGSVSYLEVLLSATSFSDFLDRFQNMKTIVSKDEEILTANKQDKEDIATQKAELEKQQAEQKTLAAQKKAALQAMQQKEKQKEVAIASLSKQEEDAESTSEEAEKAVEDLVKQKQALRNKLLEEQRKEQAAKAAAAGSKNGIVQPAAYNGGQLAWPLTIQGNITSEFGYRIDPIKKVNKLHKGLDIAAPKGTTILAAEDGTVILASWVSGYGNCVVIDHGNGMQTWYGHMSAISVSEGDNVKRGKTKVGEVGSTGDSTGNHLHFEVRQNDDPKNPRSYLGI